MLFEIPKKADKDLWVRSLLGGEQCILCGENTTQGRDLFCETCRRQLNAEAGWICPRCGAVVSDCLCVPAGMRFAGIGKHIKLFPYYSGAELVSGKLLFRLKSRRDRLLARRIADLWAARVLPLLMTEGRNAADVCVTYVPRSKKRRRENGTDQAEELAKALAKRIGCAFFDGISRKTDGQMQKTLNRADRGKNAESLFVCTGNPRPCVLLADDLVTTGETVAACARLLRREGAETVLCLSLAHTIGGEVDYLCPEVFCAGENAG